MKIINLHPWDVSHQKAIDIQKTLRSKLIFKTLPETTSAVAGTDVSFAKKSAAVWGGVVLLTYPGLEKIDESWVKRTTDFPYIRGLLSFREVPVLLAALKKLHHNPDVILCDGQGIAHPRGLGLASHLGLVTGIPTIGCAKSRLVGEYSEVGQMRGDCSPLSFQGKAVGAVLRTKTRVKPMFVSPGYAVTINDSISMTLNCGKGYRIPEPTRQAHLLVNRLRRRQEAPSTNKPLNM
jgi:deoxyribonuclease V